MSKPKVFIGSSSEGINVANAVFKALEAETEPCLWKQGIFLPGDYLFESLEKQLKASDFAIFVATPDDFTKKRGIKSPSMRDNVLFEFGLFAGALGRKRTFLLIPKSIKLNIPTDLYGLICPTYDDSRISEGYSDLLSAVHGACLDIIQVIRNEAVNTVSNYDLSDEIAKKAIELGLLDISIGRSNLHKNIRKKFIDEIINDTPENGDIFIVARTLLFWTGHFKELADAIITKKINCMFVMADPTIQGLKSLVDNDPGLDDLKYCWEIFGENKKFHKYLLSKRNRGKSGTFKLFGIPAYIPTSFSAYVDSDGKRFCFLEPGIGVAPEKRTCLFFKEVSDNDIYKSLYSIYSGIIKNRMPIYTFE